MPHQAIGDIELYYELHGTGAPVVLLHGLQGDSSNFRELVPHLARRHRVLVFDQRGSGWSDKPEGEYTTALLADDTAALLDGLGIPEANVVGVSMGGMVAQTFALRRPGRVRSLVLGCTSASGTTAVSLDGEGRESAYDVADLAPDERVRRLARAGLSGDFLRARPDVVDELVAARRARPLDPAALARRRRALEAHDVSARLTGIGVPTLVITGLADTIIEPGNSRALAHALPRGRLETFDGVGHLFWLEKPRETADLLLRFLASNAG